VAIFDSHARFDKLLLELKQFESFDIRIGFIEPEFADDGSTYMAQVAAWNEFGTDDIPARPFLSRALDTNHDKIREQFRKEINLIIEGKQDAMKAAKRLGIFGVSLVKKSIRDSRKWAEANADSTIEQKGSSKPLVDTGEMLNSVGWVIEKNGSPVASSS